MTNAVILAAGKALRLGSLTENMPKALVKVNGKPILQYQLEALDNPCINRVYIVAGHCWEQIYRETENSRVRTTIVQNVDYANTNNMYSLSLALEVIDREEPLIVLNGDVVFEPSLMRFFVKDSREDLIAVDEGAYLPESMKVVLDSDTLLLTGIDKGFSKERAFGVSIDLYKFSPKSLIKLKDLINKLQNAGNRNSWTETAIHLLLARELYPAEPYHIANSPWWEIDDFRDLKIAECIFRKTTDIAKLLESKLFLFDLDGTLIRGKEAINRANLLLHYLRRLGKKIAIMTNNSSRGIEESRHLASDMLHFPFTADEIYSSTHATIMYLKEKEITRVYPVGTKAFVRDLQRYNIFIDDMDPEAVVVAFDNEVNYGKLSRASLFLREGKHYIATHSDLVCPVEYDFVPDAGSFIAFFEASTGRKPDIVLGKPNEYFLNYIVNLTGVKHNKIVLVGDRLYTDIRMGKEGKCQTALVLSGESRICDLLETKWLPDFVFRDVAEIYDYCVKEDKK